MCSVMLIFCASGFHSKPPQTCEFDEISCLKVLISKTDRHWLFLSDVWPVCPQLVTQWHHLSIIFCASH